MDNALAYKIESVTGTFPQSSLQAEQDLGHHRINCQIRRDNLFARKNYFYPDLPKGYQITQDKTPICHDGHLEVRLPDGSLKRVGITRIHMEEDAGKSMHLAGETETLVDLNRAGVPLLPASSSM